MQYDRKSGLLCPYQTDSRICTFAGTTMWRGGRPFSSMSIRTRTLSRAISSTGCSMVVIRGTKNLLISMPSKPITPTSSGTRRPMSVRARMTPIATVSDMQKTAVVSLCVAKKARVVS